MRISVNGTVCEVQTAVLSYEDVVKLAGGNPAHSYSVTYAGPRQGDHRRTGSLWTGKTVIIEQGMDFSAMITGNG